MENLKECKTCNVYKHISDFYISYKNNGKNIYKSNCISCHKNKSIKYSKLNPERVSKIRKKYNINNKEKIQEYYYNNKEKIKKYNKKYLSDDNNLKVHREQVLKNHKKRLKEDPYYKLLENLRQSLYKKIKHYKKQSSKLYLGCSIEKYRSHLESQFYPEMTWENHGEIWEIDHIKPCASFDLTNEKQQKECFHYTNLQPLFKTTAIAESFGYSNIIGNRNKYKHKIYNS